MDIERTLCILCRIALFTGMFLTHLFLAELILDSDYVIGITIYAFLPFILIWEFSSIMAFCFGEPEDFFENAMEERK